ncbi:hypothetical protein [uncultured Amnibacterium sp.]|uniref:hypothetical protein n=1 Tax=uncultured Amnibacterium sp. TaxID=1631851 RepID=UPI0035CB758C
MTAASAEQADRLTRAIAAVDGVEAVFPDRAAAAVVRAVVSRGAAGDRGSVRVEVDGDTVRIVARLAVARSVPSSRVVADVTAAVAAALGSEGFALELEVAAID